MKLQTTALILAISLFTVVILFPATVPAEEETNVQADEIHELMRQAKKLGAKGQLPHAWWDLDSRLEEAEKNGATPEQWAALNDKGRHLVNAAAFIEDMRSRKSGMEALLGRFDQALAEIATLYGVGLDPVLSGTGLAGDLIDQLNDANLQRQVLVDSLTVENRRFIQAGGGRAADQESLITVLQVEVSSLRRQLWESELRVGVAEADRSAAESVLTKKQKKEEAVAFIRSSISTDEGEVLLTAGGEVVMQVYGVSFGVGSATLKSGQDDLVDRIVAAIGMFPGGEVRVEGHTDDTGGKDANLRLSRRRAESVARLLEKKLNRDEGTIATEGFGPDKPIALNSTPEGRALNRRIDVVIKDKN